MRTALALLTAAALCAAIALPARADDDKPALPYPIVDTGQTRCFGDGGQLGRVPRPGEAFHGQDAFHRTRPPAYRDNGDGTVSDLNTGLMWVKARGRKVTFADAVAGAKACRAGGHDDWRMPTIKELYSLIDFRGRCRRTAPASTPYLDAKVFDFAYGDASKGERVIDCQDFSATRYVGRTMGGNATVFGVNFADGRIKGYPQTRGRRGVHKLYVRYVRGNPAYGRNDFRDNGDGTITDRATGLMWTRDDSGRGMTWRQALAYAAACNRRGHLGHGDWRLPDAKELQSIVDYTRAPDVTGTPAIDRAFRTSKRADGTWPFFWSSTTHLEGPPDRVGSAAVYVAFGRGLGWMRIPPWSSEARLLDVHGAGCQRSDPKSGDPSRFPRGRGPQGDVIRILNHVRLVRSVDPSAVELVRPDTTGLPEPRRRYRAAGF